MMRLTLSLLTFTLLMSAADLPTKKYLDLKAIKTMVAAAEAEAAKRNVQVTLCIMDEHANLLFLQKADGLSINTVNYAMRKAKHSALYRRPSKTAADQVKAGNVATLVMPEAFPNQGGLPIQVDGQWVGAISASGAPSEVDEAIAQAGIDALLKP